MNFFKKNKIKLISLLIVLSFSIFLGKNFSYAQTLQLDPATLPRSGELWDMPGQINTGGVGTPTLATPQEQISGITDKFSPEQEKDKEAKPIPGECFTWSYGFQWDVCFSNWLAEIASWLLWLVSSVLWIADKVFNFAVDQSIYEMSSYMGQSVGLSGVITAAWQALRDIVNIFALMIMLYIAIGTILQLDGVNWKKMIGSIIIAAILINFSMAIAKVVIDVSNVFAIYFYEKAVPRVDGKSMAAQLTKALDIAQHMEKGKIDDPNLTTIQDAPPLSSIAMNTLGIIVLILVTSFVLFAGALLLIIRLVSLIFAVIFSPLPYIGMVIPKWGGQIAGDYWNTLINQSLFAPAYMFCLYLSMQIIACGGKDIITKGGAGENWIFMIGFYIILISFMFGSLIVAKKMGAAGAGAAEKFGKWATTATVGLATGSAMLAAGTARSVARGVSKGSEGQEGGRIMGTLRNIGDDWKKNVAKPATEKITTKAGMLYESAKDKVTSPGDTISGLVKAGTGFDIMATKGEKEATEKAEKAYKAKQEVEKKKKEMERVAGLADWDNMTQEQRDRYAKDNNLNLTEAEDKAKKEFKEYADEKHNGNLDNARKGIEKEIRDGLSLFRGDKIIDLGVKKLMENNGKIAQWLDEAQIKALEEKGDLKPDDLIKIQNAVHSNERNYRGRKYVELDVVQRNWNSNTYDTKEKKIKALKSMSSKNAAELEDVILNTDEAAEAFDKDDVKKLREVGRKKLADKIEARKNLPDIERQLVKVESDLTAAGGFDPSLIAKRDDLKTKVSDLKSVINNP